MKLLVEIEGEKELVEAVIDARDRRAFERNGAREIGAPVNASLKDITASRPETFTGWLAWHALYRLGKTDKKTWVEFEPLLIGTTVEEVDEEEDGLGDPTRPVMSAG